MQWISARLAIFGAPKPKATPARTTDAWWSELTLVLVANYPIILFIGFWELVRRFGNQMPEVYRRTVEQPFAVLSCFGSFLLLLGVTYALSRELGQESLCHWANTKRRGTFIRFTPLFFTLLVCVLQIRELYVSKLPMAYATVDDPRLKVNQLLDSVILATVFVMVIVVGVQLYRFVVKPVSSVVALNQYQSQTISLLALGAFVLLVVLCATARWHIYIGRALGSLAVLDILTAMWMCLFTWLALPRVGNRWVLNGLILLTGISFIDGQKNREIKLVPRAKDLGYSRENPEENLGDEKRREFLSSVEQKALKETFGKWLRKRGVQPADKTSPREPYPVFLLCADGGGISAAAVSSLFLAVANEGTDGNFARHVFCASTVSGGSVGTASFLCLDSQRRVGAVKPDQIRGQIVRLMSEDHLAPMILTMLTSEVINEMIPLVNVPHGDRSQLLTQSFVSSLETEAQVSDPVPDTRSEARRGADRMISGRAPLSSFSPPADRPLESFDPDGRFFFVPNATVADTGKRFAMTDLPIPLGVSLASLRTYLPNHEPSLMDAASLSARFPVVPSSGFLPVEDGGVSLVDGGLAENSGISTMTEIFRQLLTVPGADQCKFIVIHIGTIPDDSENVVRDSPDNEATTYLRTLANVLLSGNGRAAKQLRNVFQDQILADTSSLEARRSLSGGNIDDYVKARLETTTVFISGEARQLPLGWTLSKGAVRDIEFQLGAGFLPGKFSDERNPWAAGSKYRARRQENLKTLEKIRAYVKPGEPK